MKKSILLISIVLYLSSCSLFKNPKSENDYPVKPVSFTYVQLTDQFWLPRLETNRKVTIPYDFKKCEETYRIDNFAVAGGIKKGSFKGCCFHTGV